MAEKTKTRKGPAVTAPRPGSGQALEVPYASKVSLPVRRPAIIRRERLIETLRQAAERRIAVVSAPAGYGKTTLLLDFAQTCAHPVCWYALDERDRDLCGFLRYVVGAGQKQFPGFGAELAEALEEGREIAAKEAVDLLVSACQFPDREYVLILDDFHFLDEAPEELREALDGWLYRLPPQCHVVVSGRTQPQLRVLPLMSVRQEVQTIALEDFSFTCEEVAQLFREVLGKDISLDDAQHLADLTEGWAAALVLMADKVSARAGSLSLEALRGSDTLFQYISLEQFEPLPDDVRAFLTGGAVSRTLDDATINELLEISDAEDTLNFLARLNLFVLPDEKQPGKHRFHRLFRAFLVSYLRAQEPERFRALNLRAAEMMEREGKWEDAVYHYVQTAEWDRIIQATDKVGWQLFEEGKWDTLAEWLEAVPPEELALQPRLMLWKARILHYLSQADRSLALLAQATTAFEAREEWPQLAEALVVRGMALRVRGDYDESKEVLLTARSLLDEHGGPQSLIVEARKELGITLSQCGELAQAAEELLSVLEVCEAAGDTYNIAHVSDNLGTTLIFLGRLAEASNSLEAARTRWVKIGNDKHLLQTLNNLGFSYYLAGDYTSAENSFKEALVRARASDSTRAETYLLASLGDIRRDVGDYTAALQLYEQSLENAYTVEDAYVSIYTMDAIANTYRLMGDLTNSAAWSGKAMVEAEKTGGAMEIGVCLVTEGLLQAQQGNFKEATGHLEKALPHLEQAGAKRELASACFHLAGVYFSLKRKTLALEMLQRCADLVADLGHDHFLLVHASRQPLLIQYAAANKIADGYYTRLLKVIRSSSSGTATAEDGEAAEEQTAEAANGVAAYGFGNPRTTVGGQEVTDLEWRSEKSKEMFFFFLCNRRGLRKEEIVAAIWPDLPEDKSTNAFHGNMYRLRAALYKDVIAKDSGRYILDPQGQFRFDVDDFQKALEQANAAPKDSPEAIAAMEKALAVYKGQFAPDFYSEWAENLRWQMEEQYTSLLATLAAAYTQAKEYKKSADICQKIIEMDEFNEAAWYRLMSNYIASDQTEAAKYCYERYAQIVAQDEEMAEDLPEFQDIVREIAAAGR